MSGQRPSPPSNPLPGSTNTLGALVDDLALPLQARTRLLDELTQDLEGMTDRLVSRGVPVEEARRRAKEMVVPHPSTLVRLERISTPRYRRITRGVDPTVLRMLERAALAFATVALLAGQAPALLAAGLLDDPSPFLWPVISMGAVTLTVVLAKAFELWIKGQHDRPRRGLGAILGLVALTLGTAGGGVLVDLVRLATAMESGPPDGVTLVTRWVMRDAALLSTGIMLSLTGALGWFALSSWITHAEQGHLKALRALASLPSLEQSP